MREDMKIYIYLMIYRQLGPTGIKISVIGYGNWINSNSEDSQQLTNDCVKTAW
jgi:aryl-alcohol dehydrogenase-like predicted oxidoreductase